MDYNIGGSMKSILNRRNKIILVLLFSILIVFFTLNNCKFRKHIIYDYYSTNKDYTWGELRARLMGTYRYPKNKCILTSPYELIIGFSYNDPNVERLIIKEIKLYDKITGETAFRNEGYHVKPFEYFDDYDSFDAIVIFDNLNINYLNYTLYMKYEIYSSNSLLINDVVELNFEKDYSEYWSNDILDGIMGI